MFCKKCGKPYNKEQSVCAGCGAKLIEAKQPAAKNDIANGDITGNKIKIKGSKSELRKKAVEGKFVSAFSDKLFMTACILITVSAVVSSVGIFLDVIGILFAIFMWLTYGAAKKGVANSKYMRYTSGMVYTMKIVFWISFGSAVLPAIFSLVEPSVVTESFYKMFGQYNSFFEALGVEMGIIMFLVHIIYAIVFALMNILFYNPAHKLAKSMYKSVNTGALNLEDLTKTKNCALVMVGMKILTVLLSYSDFRDIITSGCLGATYIITYLWLKKHFEGKGVNCNAN